MVTDEELPEVLGLQNGLMLVNRIYNVSKAINLLLFADIHSDALSSWKISSAQRKLPFFINCKLGWLISGAMECDSKTRDNSFYIY